MILLSFSLLIPQNKMKASEYLTLPCVCATINADRRRLI